MPLSGTLLKAQIIDAGAEINGFTPKKSIETVEILLELIKQSLRISTSDDVYQTGIFFRNGRSGFGDCDARLQSENENCAHPNSRTKDFFDNGSGIASELLLGG